MGRSGTGADDRARPAGDPMPSRERTLYIHAGTGKTGTSALQRFFVHNEALLRRDGLYYPACREDASHNNLGRAMRTEDVAARNRVRDRLAAELAEVDSNVLISAESLATHTAARIHEFFSFHPGPVVLIVYLRRQDDYISSWVQQKIKAFAVVDLAKEFEIVSNVDYAALVRDFASHPRTSQLIVRPYEKGQFRGGNIFTDFLTTLGIDWTDEMEIPARTVNPQLDRDALEFLRLTHGLEPQRGEVALTPGSFSMRLVPKLVAYSRIECGIDGPFSTSSLLSPAERHRLLRPHLEGNAWIARTFLGREDGRLFYLDPPAPDAPWKPYTGLSPESAERILRFLMDQEPELVWELRRRLLDRRTHDRYVIEARRALNRPVRALTRKTTWLESLCAEWTSWARPGASRTHLPAAKPEAGVARTQQAVAPAQRTPEQDVRWIEPNRLAGKTLYIHIGMPKTGTTAMQWYCHHCTDQLAEHGFLYPSTGRLDTAHHALAASLWRREVYWMDSVRTGTGEFLRTIVDQADRQGLSKILLSSELFLFLPREGTMDLFRRMLEGVDVRIICYVRRMDGYLCSSIHQTIKAMAGGFNPRDYNEGKDIPFVRNFIAAVPQYLQGWLEAFSPEQLILRPYERSQCVGGDTISDLLSILGIDTVRPEGRPPGNLNPRMTDDALEYKRLVNILFAKTPAETTPFVKPLVEYSSQADRRCAETFNPGGERWISPQVRRRIVLDNAELYEHIARDYLHRPDGTLFHEPLPDADEPWSPYPGLSVERAREITDYLHRRHPSLVLNLAEALKTDLRNTPERAYLRSVLAPALGVGGTWTHLRSVVHEAAAKGKRVVKALLGRGKPGAR
jgi:hypothetical protein